MKQVIKAILPKPIINKAIQIRDDIHLISTSQLDCDPTNLCSSESLLLQNIYADKDVKTAWDKDHNIIAEAYGDDDNFGGVNPGDRRALYYLIMALKPQNVLEVGTHIGASTLHIARALKQLGQKGKVTSVDIVDVNHPETGAWKQLGLKKSPSAFAKGLNCLEHINFHVSPSLEFMNQTDQRYDFIFLDGDHTALAVYREVTAALPLLNKNGVILLHDYYPEAKPLYPDKNIINGPFKALKRINQENSKINVLPLGNLPWPTKQGTNMTSLALLVKS